MTFDWTGDAGVFLRRDALALGYDDRTIRAMVARGLWHRIRRGAYVAAESWEKLDAVGRHRLTARAVLRTAHPSAVLTHISSALEHEAPSWGVDLSEVHLTRLDGRGGRREAGVVHHRGSLVPGDVVQRYGLPVSSPGRAVIEVTTMAGVEASLVTANWVLARTGTTPVELARLVEACRHWPDTLHTDLVVRLADPRCAWPGEARLSYLLWRAHVAGVVPQYEVRDEYGNLLAVLDFGLPHLGVFLEFDGSIKYDRLLGPGETLADVVLREKRREELVCRLLGWVCIRITWEDLDRPATTTRRIQSMLASRRTIGS